MTQDITELRQFRSRLLQEVARLTWQHRLEAEVEELPERFIRQWAVPGKDPEDKRDRLTRHIRLALGLQPDSNGESLKAAAQRALRPEKSEYPVVLPVGHCRDCTESSACQKACPMQALGHDEKHRVHIKHEICNSCGMCTTACSLANLADKTEFVPLLHILQQARGPVFAAVAPAFTGQFGPEVTPGKLRSALRGMGFVEMAEVAFFADILTLKEAYEFDRLVGDRADFMITSCCCPVWLNLVEKQFPALLKHVSPSVSPMIAAGRLLKTAVPAAKVVFIGPCVAKKAEAKQANLAGAIDYVLTFKELSAIFAALDIKPATLPDRENPQASWGGRAYARTGGVTAAISRTLEKISPHRATILAPAAIDGVTACQRRLKDALSGELEVNFLEGMACPEGCIGGPGVNIAPETGTKFVETYRDQAQAPTPLDNPEVRRLLQDLQLHDLRHITGDGRVAGLLRRSL